MIPTGDFDDAATVAALTFDMPTCEGDECDNTAERALFDADAARFVALCIECEPIPFDLAPNPLLALAVAQGAGQGERMAALITGR